MKEEDIERQENETTRNVHTIANILQEEQPINLFEFIVNPESFGQTVENMFYLSFLIRDGKASIDDESGQPILSMCILIYIISACIFRIRSLDCFLSSLIIIARCEAATSEDYQGGLIK